MPVGLRATAVVVRDGRVLLVRDKGKRQYSLPGGGINKGEPSIAAAARELYEELGLSADRIERVLTYGGGTRRHSVFLITAFHGELRIKSELDKFLWWDRKSEIPLFEHVEGILGQIAYRVS